MPHTKSQLAKIKRLLRRAYEAALDARAEYNSAGDAVAAGRCKDIARDILYEVDYLDSLIAKAP